MHKVITYSLLLVAGLGVSQFLADHVVKLSLAIRLATMVTLAFIMIHVGYEFEIDKSRPRQYVWDYLVAFTAAAFPWILCAAYFVYAMAPREIWGHGDVWRESLLQGRFASPTSAGVLFAMLAAAGLAATWTFKKARILAIFDDLDTILLMIPLKVLMVGFRWQLMGIVLIIGLLLWMAWRYLHRVQLPVSWPFVASYSVAIAGICELIYVASHAIDHTTPVHLEVLLPAFVLGCMLARRPGEDPHAHDSTPGAEQGPGAATEQRVSTIVSASFMVLVGLSMPPITSEAPTIPAAPAAEYVVDERAPSTATLAYAGVSREILEDKQRFPGWGVITLHVVAITLLSNLGKMFPAFCYRREANWRQRLALAVGMFPRGEVGAGVLVISLSYGIAGPALSVATLSLALNLVLTGAFILIVKKLLVRGEPGATFPIGAIVR